LAGILETDDRNPGQQIPKRQIPERQIPGRQIPTTEEFP
jgi:hypothetical protein